jgi:dolichyl-phosphate-mannose-protein mannosyltransferase
LAYGSRVSFKNSARNGGLLHSHIQKFPGGSEQQQITTYSHKDSNNEWIVERGWSKDWQQRNVSADPVFVKDGDVVRLVHDTTGKNLHSHAFPAPVTGTDAEVSGYGDGKNFDQEGFENA